MNAQRIIDAALHVAKHPRTKAEIEYLGWAPAYSEPGYSDPKRGGIYFANWNDVTAYANGKREILDDTMGRLAGALETYGAEIQWSDEWQTCYQCGNAIRTQPDSYGWQPAYFMTKDGEVCHNCVAEDPGAYLAKLEGNADRCWTLDIDPADHGYRLLEEGFENGMYPGQNDDPREIAARLREQGIDRFVFRLNDVGQFDARFSVYAPIYEQEGDNMRDYQFRPESRRQEFCDDDCAEAWRN